MNTDFSAAVPALFIIIGILLSFKTGSQLIKPLGCMGFISVGIAAVVLGIVLMFLNIFAHGICIDELKLCKSRGDGNMSYWFQSFFAIPAFWLIMVGSAKTPKSDDS